MPAFGKLAATRGVLWKKMVLEISQNSPENTCARSQACNFIKEEVLAQVFYCEFCNISKNTFFTENLWATASEVVTEMLIFTSSRSQMFLKISVLKNFAVIMEPLFNNKVTDFLLQNTYGACFWIFVAANTFFLLIMVFIADSRTGFCSGHLWKHELNLRSNHWSYS